MLGFPSRLDFLGRLRICCPLLRGLLRVLLVGRLWFGLATTGLAAGASSIVLAYSRTTTLLALMAMSVVLAYASTTTLLAIIALSVVLANARPTTLLAL